MTQRKLTDDELQKVMAARHDIKTMCSWDDTDRGREYWYGVAKQLDAMALHATTDGNPYVDPEPLIPDGYRLAVAGDEIREDARWWDERKGRYRDSGKWSAGVAFGKDCKHIVPIDRTPTDEEAKSRPEVMVRDCDGQKWHKHILLMVRGGEHNKYKFVTTSKLLMEVVCWKQCRHLYPGE